MKLLKFEVVFDIAFGLKNFDLVCKVRKELTRNWFTKAKDFIKLIMFWY